MLVTLVLSSMSVAGLALAACAVPTAACRVAKRPAARRRQRAKKVTVRFHARIGQQEDTLYDMQIPKFMEENPDIEIVKE